jgi:hypothetical protein
MTRDADAVYSTLTEGAAVDLGEYWPALHYTLSGEAPMPRHVAVAEGVEWDDESLENALMGGEPTPYEDGLTVARVLSPKTVQTVRTKLRKLTPEDLQDRVDDGIDDFLPTDWPAEKKRATVAASFMRLADCFGAAANASEGILLYVP